MGLASVQTHLNHSAFSRYPMLARVLVVSILLILSYCIYPTFHFQEASGLPQTTDWGPKLHFMGNFLLPTEIAVSPSGEVYVADPRGNNIQKFTEDGGYLQTWDESNTNNGFLSPVGVAIDQKSGDVYVLEEGSGGVQKFTSNGTFLAKWGGQSGLNTVPSNGTFRNPTGIATDSNGYVYVVDSGNARIQKFDQNGTYVSKWGEQGTGRGQFSTPALIAVDSSGDVYVTDTTTALIQKFSSTGTFLNSWNLSAYSSLVNNTQLNSKVYPLAIATDEVGNVYVSTTPAGIVKLSPDGILIGKWKVHATTSTLFGFIPGLAVNHKNGNLYAVFDSLEPKVQVYSTQGDFIKEWGGRASTDDQIIAPIGISTDSLGNVFVLDSGHWRVDELASSGASYLNRWNLSLSSDTYARPSGIAVASRSGTVFVVDDSHGVTKYDLTGKVLNRWNFSEQIDPNNRSAYDAKIAADPNGNVYVLQSGTNLVKKFSPSGQLIVEWDLPKGQDGTSYPTALASGPNGEIYVTDYSQGVVEKFSSEGKPILKWGSSNPGTGESFTPYTVAVNQKTGDVYASDVNNFRIQEFTDQGKFVTKFGTEGRGPGQFMNPTILTVDSAGSVYVIDSLNNFRIQKFNADSIFITKAGDHPPIASAGRDFTVRENTVANLNASASFDPDMGNKTFPFNERLSYSWRQVSGPFVELSDIHSENPSFTSPIIASNSSTMTFELTVEDYLGLASWAAVHVTVISQNANNPSSFLHLADPISLGGMGTNSSSGDVSVASEGNHVYIVWTEGYTVMVQHRIMIASSSDAGLSFSNPIQLDGTSAFYVNFRQISTSGSHVYVLWSEQNVSDFNNKRLIFAKSDDYGAHFSNPIVVTKYISNPDTSNMAASGSDLYIVWAGGFDSLSEQEADPLLGPVGLVLISSTDYGQTFGKPADVVGNGSVPDGRPFLAITSSAGQQPSLVLGWVGQDLSKSYIRTSADHGKSFGNTKSFAGRLESTAAERNTVALLFERADRDTTKSYYTFQDNMFLMQSSDGGVTFNNVTELTKNTSQDAFTYSDPTVLLPSNQTIVIQWTRTDNTGDNSTLYVLASQDGGKTFHTTLIDRYSNKAVLPDGSSLSDTTSMPRFAADSDGRVYLVYMAPVSTEGDYHAFLAFSADHGNTFARKMQLDNTAGNFALSPRISLTETSNQSNYVASVVWIGGKFDSQNFWKTSLSEAVTFYTHSTVIPEFTGSGQQLILLMVAIMAAIVAAPRVIQLFRGLGR